MSDLSKKLGIFAATIFEAISLTGIAPFYPSIAKSQGIPTWLIGMIFSAAPFMSLLWSPFVPSLMERFGRRFVLLTGLILIGLGNLLMIFVIMTPLSWCIIVSFLGRFLVGMGYSWTLTSSYATLTSDFPEQAAKMIALIEITGGIGLTIGPSFGSLMFGLTNYIYTCLSFALLNISMIPLLFIFLGKMRKYEIIREKPISLLEILKKPKIAMDFGVQVMVMFSVGFIMPTSEFHLQSYSVKASEAGYFFSICTFSYLTSSLVVSFLPSKWNKPRVMLFGIFFMAFGFLLIGPCEYIFPDSLIVVVFGLATIGLAGGFMYVFSLPHMLEVAVQDYGFSKDDRLHDALSGLTTASLCIGEIIGPTLSSILYSSIGYANSSNVVFLILALCALGYGVFSDAFKARKVGILEEKDMISGGTE